MIPGPPKRWISRRDNERYGDLNRLNEEHAQRIKERSDSQKRIDASFHDRRVEAGRAWVAQDAAAAQRYASGLQGSRSGDQVLSTPDAEKGVYWGRY